MSKKKFLIEFLLSGKIWALLALLGNLGVFWAFLGLLGNFGQSKHFFLAFLGTFGHFFWALQPLLGTFGYFWAKSAQKCTECPKVPKSAQSCQNSKNPSELFLGHSIDHLRFFFKIENKNDRCLEIFLANRLCVCSWFLVGRNWYVQFLLLIGKVRYQVLIVNWWHLLDCWN